MRRWQRERKEHEPRGRVAVRQVLHPDAEGDEDRPVAEHGDRPAEQEGARVADAEELAHQAPGCCTGSVAASASSGSARACSSNGSGISRTSRRGEKRTGRNGRHAPIPPMINVSFKPTTFVSRPPVKDPSGIAPQTMKRMTEFMRP